MSPTSIIPPPPQVPADDVTPDLGPVSRGSGSGMDRARSILNNLSGGGIPAIQERLQADYAKRQHDAQMYHDLAKTHVGLLTHANASISPDTPYGINQQTGQPATAQDIQQWHNNYDTAWGAYQKLLPKDAKPIAQKMSDVVEHVIGRKGQSGAPAGQSSAPAVPPPPVSPQGAVSASPAGPAILPPPGAAGSMSTATEVPASMQPGILGLGETQRATGVQNKLAEEKQAGQQQLASTLASKQKGETQEPAIIAQQIAEIKKLPEDQQLPAMMKLGMFPASLMRPVTKLVPNDPLHPEAGAHYESYSPLAAMMQGGEGPAGFTPGTFVGKQTSTTDPFGNVTTSVRKPITGGAGAGAASAGGASPKASTGAITGRVMAVPPPLDSDGHVPVVQGVNPQLIENANRLLDGEDINKLPLKARAGAGMLARKYGWEQGKFTPKEQTQVREASTFIQQALQDQDALSALDGDFMDRAKLSQVLSNPDKEGFIGRSLTGAAAQSMDPKQTAFVQMYNQLVGTIAGLSKLVRPGGTTEAQIERLKSELPNPVTTKNSADARARLQRLQKEIDIAMAKGNFGQLGAVTTPAAPSRLGAIPPPPAGAKKQAYQLGGKWYDAQTHQVIQQGAQ